MSVRARAVSVLAGQMSVRVGPVSVRARPRCMRGGCRCVSAHPMTVSAGPMNVFAGAMCVRVGRRCVRGDRRSDTGPAIERGAVAVDHHDRGTGAGFTIAHADPVDVDERRIGGRTSKRSRMEARATREDERQRAGGEGSQGISLRTSASEPNSLSGETEVVEPAVAVATEPKHSVIHA